MKKALNLILFLFLLPASLSGQELVKLYRKGTVILNADPAFSVDLNAAQVVDEKSRYFDWVNQNGLKKEYFTDFAFSPDGSLYLLAGDNQCVIYRFDRNGGYISMFRHGARSKSVYAYSNSIDVLDNKYLVVGKYDRILIFDMSGTLYRTIEMDYPIRKCVALKNDKIAVLGAVMVSGPKWKHHVTIMDIQTEKETTVIDYLEPLKNSHIMFETGQDTLIGLGNPFRKFRTSIARTPSGDLVVGYSENSEIYIFTPDGKRKSRFSLDYPALPVTQVERDEHYNEMRAKSSNVAKKIKIPEEALEVIETPEYFPAHWPYYYDIKVDTDNNILVFKYTKDKEHTFRVYQVYSDDGTFICETTIDPADFDNPNIKQMKFFKGDLYGLFSPEDSNAEKELFRIDLKYQN